jgi:hypothetical protein
MIWILVAFKLYTAVQVSLSELNSPPILVENMQRLAPSLDVATAKLHVEAAEAAGAATGIEPELLLAVAFVESHYDPTWTSHVTDGERHTLRWPSREQLGHGPWFCGPLQTKAEHDWRRCLAMREPAAGYLAGARELFQWLRYARGDVAAALDGHGCGTYGLRTRKCNHYAARVLARWRRLMARSASS